MGTKVTSSSGSVLEEPEIQKLQMQAKIFKENSLNKLNALKSTTQLLERQTFSDCILYQQAFAQLFETLHEMDSKSALSVIKVQFERFINSDLLKPLDIYSRSFSSDREVRENFRDYTKMTAQTFKETIIQNMNSIEQCIVERASHEQELKMTLKKLVKDVADSTVTGFQDVQSSVTSFRDETSRWKNCTQSMIKECVLPMKDNILRNNAAECANERDALANLIANLTLDTEENKMILKQLKKANASLTPELENVQN
ncbi:hypothetical protein Tco_0336317 [Tanacetum coccineum]